MALPPFDRAHVEAAFASRGAIVGIGEGADIDEAYDSATSYAYDHPSAGTSITVTDPGDVTAHEAARSFDGAVTEALAWLQENPDATDVAAFSFLGRAGHTRTTRRARVEGVEHGVDETPASTWAAPERALTAALTDENPLEDGEQLDTFTYTRRASYKPIVTNNNKAADGTAIKGEAQFVVINADTIVSRGHRTAGEARRAAVDLLKAYPKDNHTTPQLDVWKLAGREGGLPLLQVLRTRVKQVLAVKAVYTRLKPTAKEPKIAGWVFVTPDPAGRTPLVGEDAPEPSDA